MPATQRARAPDSGEEDGAAFFGVGQGAAGDDHEHDDRAGGPKVDEPQEWRDAGCVIG